MSLVWFFSYVFNFICAHRADQALSTLAMRKFCEDKVSSSLQPSQNRYIFPVFLSLLILYWLLLTCSSHTFFQLTLMSFSAGISITLEGCSQGPSKWTAVLSSSIRSSFLPSPTSRKMEVSECFHGSMRSFVSMSVYSFVKRNLLHIHTHISSLF